LHPRSILLDAHGHIVLTNFENADYSSSTSILNLNQLELDMMGYRAPEILLGWSHDSAVDCWSFGMLLYYMFFGTVIHLT
jgi:serine/threonine protein kinase